MQPHHVFLVLTLGIIKRSESCVVFVCHAVEIDLEDDASDSDGKSAT